METRSEHGTAANGAAVELGILSHEGKDFSALGSIRDEGNGYIVGYPKGSGLQTWDGQDMGIRLQVVSSWPVRSYIGTRMYAYCADIGGVRYHGRGFGDGIVLKLHRSK